MLSIAERIQKPQLELRVTVAIGYVGCSAIGTVKLLEGRVKLKPVISF
jgi:hypothetical protein